MKLTFNPTTKVQAILPSENDRIIQNSSGNNIYLYGIEAGWQVKATFIRRDGFKIGLIAGVYDLDADDEYCYIIPIPSKATEVDKGLGVSILVYEPSGETFVQHSMVATAMYVYSSDNIIVPEELETVLYNALNLAVGNLSTNINTHKARIDNPHSVTKAQVGLGNADNTSDVNKPVSIDQQLALDLKENLSNKRTSWNSTPSNTPYPSEKLVKDSLDLKVDKATTILGIDLANDIARAEFVAALGNATTLLSGLLSPEDYSLLVTLRAMLGEEADVDTFVNTFNEILAIFSNYPEGVDIVTALAGKVDKVDVDDFLSDESENPVQNKVVTKEFEERFDVLQSKNLFDYTKCVDGYYVPYTTGIPDALSGYCYSDYMDVDGLSNVAFGRSSETAIGSFHCCFYDYNYNFISGALATTDQPYVSIPANAKYLIFSCGMTQAPEVVVSRGTTPITGANYCYCMRIVVPKTKSDVDIELTDGALFRYFLNTVDGMGNEKHNINLILPKGTYQMNNYFVNAESSSSSFEGLFVPNYVKLVGKGEPEETILNLTLQTQNSQLSTLNIAGTSGLKNLKITGTNVRYAVHDDFAVNTYGEIGDKYYRNVENCIFETTTPVYGTYGSGTRSGAILKFKNCVFYGFSWHSNTEFELPNDITFENCIFKLKNYQGVILKSLASGVVNKVHFIGCNIPMITCTEEETDIGYDFEIDGYGNNDIPVNWVNPTHPIQCFSDKISVLQSNTTYSKGMCIYKTSYIFGKASNPYVFDGILLENANNGDFVKILNKGYYLARDLNLDNLNDGDLITVDNTGLVVGSTNDKIIGRISTQWSTKFLKIF